MTLSEFLMRLAATACLGIIALTAVVLLNLEKHQREPRWAKQGIATCALLLLACLLVGIWIVDRSPAPTVPPIVTNDTPIHSLTNLERRWP